MKKKFKITWYEGTIETVDKVLKECVTKEESINSVNATALILPKKELERVYYTRGLLWSDKKHTIDYGSHTRFINIEEIE